MEVALRLKYYSMLYQRDGIWLSVFFLTYNAVVLPNLPVVLYSSMHNIHCFSQNMAQKD